MSPVCIFAPLGERGEDNTDPKVKCDRAGCRKVAVGYAVFPWGAAALCEKHMADDCPAPAETQEPSTTAEECPTCGQRRPVSP